MAPPAIVEMVRGIYILGALALVACSRPEERTRMVDRPLAVLQGDGNFGPVPVTTTSPPRTLVVAPAPPATSLQFDIIDSIESTCPEFELDAPGAAGAIVNRTCTMFSGGEYGDGELTCVAFAEQTYSFQVRFKPVLEVPTSGQCRVIVRFDGGVASSIPVSGIGIAPPLRAEYSTRSNIDFLTVNLGTPSTPRTIQVTNTGSQALTVSAATSTANGVFEITGTTAAHQVAPGNVSTYSVLCRPPVGDPNGTPYAGSIAITTNDPDPADATVNIKLDCVGTDHPIKDTPGDEVTVDVLQEVEIDVGLDNLEATTLTGISVTLIAPVQPGLAIKTPPSTSLAPGASTTVTLTWKPPEVFDGMLGALALKVDGEADRTIPIAKGIAKLADVTSDVPATEKLDFGKLCIGESRMRTIKMRPASNDTSAFADYVVTGASATAPFTAAVTGSTLVKVFPPTEVTIDVTAMPMISDGKFEGTVTVTTDSFTEPTYPVPVVVEVLQGGATVSPALLNFREVVVTGFSDTKTAVFRNCTADAVEITGIALDGESAADFDIIQIMPDGVEMLPPFTLPRNGEVLVAVQMLPQSDGAKEAQISIDFQEPNKPETSTETIALLGEGFLPTPDRDSYYRCSAGSPIHALPLLVVGMFLVLRRRRR